MTHPANQPLLDLAFEFCSKAVKARDDFYQGIRDAQGDFYDGRGNYKSIADAELRASQTAVMKNLIADNRWHMQQSMMFSSLAQAETARQLLWEQQKTNKLLAQLLEKM